MKGKWFEHWKEYLPLAGIFIFASGSVHSLRHLFALRAQHDTSLFWALSIALELATAYAVWQIVGMARNITKSRQTKENRKFYKGLFWSLIVLILPSFGTSIWANYVEFQGSLSLALLCPMMAIVCAILSGLPYIEKAFRESKEAERVAKEEARPLPKVRKPLPATKRREKIYALLRQDLDQNPTDLGKRFGVTPQTIRNDFKALAKEGKIIYKDGRVSLRPQKIVAKT